MICKVEDACKNKNSEHCLTCYKCNTDLVDNFEFDMERANKMLSDAFKETLQNQGS